MLPQLIFEILLPYLMNPFVLVVLVVLAFLFYNEFITPGPTLYKALPFLIKPDETEEPTPISTLPQQPLTTPLDLNNMEPEDALNEILKPPDQRESTSQEMQVADMQTIPTTDLQEAAISSLSTQTPTVTPIPGGGPSIAPPTTTPYPITSELPMPPTGIEEDAETYAAAAPKKKVSFKNRKSGDVWAAAF